MLKLQNYSKSLMDFIDQVVVNTRFALPNMTILGKGLMSPTFPSRELGSQAGQPNPFSRQAPSMLPRHNEIYAPPYSPFLIDLDKELGQFSVYMTDNKTKLLSNGPELRANGQPRVSEKGVLERVIMACEKVQERVAQGRREGKTAAA